MRRILTWTILVLVTAFAFNANADTIIFKHEGTGSGTLSGTSGDLNFYDAAFTIIGIGDTYNLEYFSFGGGGGFYIPHDSASITIDGLGNLNFSTPTETFVNNSTTEVGFKRRDGNDLYDGPHNPSFGSWMMLGSIGPFSGPGQIMQWTESDDTVDTDSGILMFDNAICSATFQATIPTVVPVPGAVWLLGSGLMFVIGYGRKFRQKKLAQ